jgi:tRNA threonylcarbamoyladenosine biosynthesis protein TsaE
MKRFKSCSPEDTLRIAREYAPLLYPNAVVALRGDLGSGKTTFVRGIAGQLGGNSIEVCSPTFSYLNIYAAIPPIYHFDLYRLTTDVQFTESGFSEFFYSGGITCIEWPDCAVPHLPEHTTFIELRHLGPTEREITIFSF